MLSENEVEREYWRVSEKLRQVRSALHRSLTADLKSLDVKKISSEVDRRLLERLSEEMHRLGGHADALRWVLEFHNAQAPSSGDLPTAESVAAQIAAGSRDATPGKPHGA